MIERELEPRLTREAIPDSVLRGVYERARSVFVHPRLVEVALLSVYTGARMKDQPRAQARDTALALDAYLERQPPATPDAFEAVASEPAWKEQGSGTLASSRPWTSRSPPTWAAWWRR
jgi:hypothetical protein